MRGHPIANVMGKVVELHRDGIVELEPELVAAEEEIERVDAFALAVAEQAVAARERVHELEVGMTSRLLATAKAGGDPLVIAAEIEELETISRRADRLVGYLEDVRERSREDLALLSFEDGVWRAMDRGLQRALDKAAKALEKLPADVDDMADLRNVPRPQVAKVRDALAEIEDAHRAYSEIRQAASSLAVVAFGSEPHGFPGDNLGALTFQFETAFRHLNYNRLKWPEGTVPFLRYVVEHREELGPWIPNEDAWRAACEAALNELVPEDVRAVREQWSGAWSG
jgi:hypothetical protein